MEVSRLKQRHDATKSASEEALLKATEDFVTRKQNNEDLLAAANAVYIAFTTILTLLLIAVGVFAFKINRQKKELLAKMSGLPPRSKA